MSSVSWVVEYVPCHGCGGRGWVPVDGRAVICPVCGGSGVVRKDPRRVKAIKERKWRA